MIVIVVSAGCETRQQVATTPVPPAAIKPPAAQVALPSPGAFRPAPDTLDVSSQEYMDALDKSVLDTLLSLGPRHYRLRLQAVADSSHELRSPSPSVDSMVVGAKPNGDFIYGVKHYYDVRYIITLLDSAGRRQFQRTFTKPAFYQMVGREVVLRSEPVRPAFVGYNAPRQWLLLRQEFGVEGTDWGAEVFLALDLKGRTQRLTPSNGYGGGGSDCRIQQSPSGQAVITCEELLLPGGRHQSLTKPRTELIAARFLSDTTLLTVYEYVTTRRVQYDGVWGNENSPNPRRRHLPNAFVLSARTGQVLASFRFDGAIEALGYHLPRLYVWQTKSYYLPDEERHLLRILPRDKPQLTSQIDYHKLPVFKAPRQPQELKINLSMGGDTSAIYLNTATHKMRYYEAVEHR
ncbi:hypothetical protein [Hymenobacter sp.]|uniref:hypothetical protein n=1 Tax=Hymenobacter sp. TaxID=1898978 RepID=UPI002D7E480F|nr:hypothetical protein [Hymenobacter sp.]